MVMVSFCWKMNFLPSKIKKTMRLLTMSLKLTIKVVAFFLGHPVYIPTKYIRFTNNNSERLFLVLFTLVCPFQLGD